MPCRPFALRCPTLDGPDLRSYAAWLGLEVSLRCYLQNGYVQCLISNKFLELRVFLLEFSQLLGHVGTHTTVLLSPAIIGLLRDLKVFTYFGNGFLPLFFCLTNTIVSCIYLPSNDLGHFGRLAQLARAPALQAGGHRFKSCSAH